MVEFFLPLLAMNNETYSFNPDPEATDFLSYSDKPEQFVKVLGKKDKLQLKVDDMYRAARNLLTTQEYKVWIGLLDRGYTHSMMAKKMKLKRVDTIQKLWRSAKLKLEKNDKQKP